MTIVIGTKRECIKDLSYNNDRFLLSPGSSKSPNFDVPGSGFKVHFLIPVSLLNTFYFYLLPLNFILVMRSLPRTRGSG